MKVGTETDLGHDYIEDYTGLKLKMLKDTVQTDWKPINDLMDGGLGWVN